MNLAALVQHSASERPDAVALRAPDGHATYAELDALANRVARTLADLGVRRGDRVGIWLEKSLAAVATMQAVLRLGAAYVPLDPISPDARIRSIIEDCRLRVLVAPEASARRVVPGARVNLRCLCLGEGWNGLSWDEVARFSAEPLAKLPHGGNELAYILYTSGSTGRPKGVCLSHGNALSFVRWAAQAVDAAAGDCFANHAPLHFDLSVFDLYVPFLVGATCVIVPRRIAAQPRLLVPFISDARITIWYSVPSALVMMMEQGNLLRASELALRAIVFAGEPFPVPALRRLRQHFPLTRMFNWYGPTETNVCTSYEVDGVPPIDATDIPIGTTVCGDKSWVADSAGKPVADGQVGELIVDGPTVMLGYWGGDAQSGRPYPTGDLVRRDAAGNYRFVGRRDDLIKVRGHRVEPGEIEAWLLAGGEVTEAAVVATGAGAHAQLVAFLVCDRSPRPTLLEIKRRLAARVPRYMIVDRVRYLARLPRTRNGKIDRRRLVAELDLPTAEAPFKEAHHALG